jgi:hypothetical protein
MKLLPCILFRCASSLAAEQPIDETSVYRDDQQIRKPDPKKQEGERFFRNCGVADGEPIQTIDISRRSAPMPMRSASSTSTSTSCSKVGIS